MKKIMALFLGVALFVNVFSVALADGEWLDFKRETVEKDGKSYGVITAYDGKKAVWKYQTASGDISELEAISDVYQNNETAYFAAHGTLYALELLSGAEKWQYRGVGESNKFAFDKYGNIYVSGYYGPNVTVFDKTGKKLYTDNNGSYCWVDNIEISDEVLNIHYKLDDMGNNDGVVTLDVTQFYPGAPKNNGIKVTLNGEEIEFDQPPISVDGRTMVPLRAVIEKMGGQITWLPETSVTQILMNAKKMQLILDCRTAFFEGDAYLLDVAPMSKNNRILLPLRFVAEQYGFGVGWDAETNTVLINTIYN